MQISTSNPQFTISIPVYNGEPYIAKTIDSLLAQTYHHFEIVVLENGSTDRTTDIVKSYQDDRIRMISSGKLLPIEQNWARILDIEEPNEYLVLMCGDDVLYPQFLEKIVNAIYAEPEASLYHSQAIFIDSNGQFIQNCKIANYNETAGEFLDAVHGSREDVFGTGYVMRFEDFKKVGGYPPYVNLLFADVFCYFALTNNSYKICIQEPLVGFRRHGSSTGYNSRDEEFTSAAADYINDLKNVGYINSSEREQSTNYYVKVIGTGRLRRSVHEFIKQQSKLNMKEFHEIYSDISDAIRHRAVFSWDVPLNWYLEIAMIQNYYVRIFIYYTIILAVRLRYWFYLRRRRRQLKYLIAL